MDQTWVSKIFTFNYKILLALDFAGRMSVQYTKHLVPYTQKKVLKKYKDPLYNGLVYHFYNFLNRLEQIKSDLILLSSIFKASALWAQKLIETYRKHRPMGRCFENKLNIYIFFFFNVCGCCSSYHQLLLIWRYKKIYYFKLNDCCFDSILYTVPNGFMNHL